MNPIQEKLIKATACAMTAIMMVTSCAPVKNIAYFQDKALNHPEQIDKHGGIVIQPKDMISIVVSSRNPELAQIFNLPRVTYQIASGSSNSGDGSSNGIMGYSVDNDGYIDFPILGMLKVAGLTRWELAELIKNRLLKEGYLTDAVVTVEFMNFKVSVLGEVNNPGTYTIIGDKVTVLEALSLAGDLTIFGERTNVTVIRELDGKRTFYNIDLCSVDMFKSPAYNLQQNDIVYVEPSEIKARQSTVDDKTLRTTSILVSSGSLLVSIATLITTIVLNSKKQ